MNEATMATINRYDRLHDLGGYLTAWLARPLCRAWNGGPDSWLASPHDWRSAARDRPKNSSQLARAHVSRTLLWNGILLVSMAAMIGIGFTVDTLTSFDGTRIAYVLGPVSVGAGAVGVANAVKAAIIWYSKFADRAYERAAKTGEPLRGTRLRLVMPSNWDVILMGPLGYVFTIPYY